MAFTTPLVTLSFLITTPGHGYPHWVTLIMVSLIYPVLSPGIERYSDAGRCCHDNGRLARDILKQRSNESSSTLKTEFDNPNTVCCSLFQASGPLSDMKPDAILPEI